MVSNRAVPVTGPLKGNAVTAETIHGLSFCGAEAGFDSAAQERATGSLLSPGMPARSPEATSPLASTLEATLHVNEVAKSPGPG